MAGKLREFDATRYLDDDEAIVAFLNSALEVDDPSHLMNAIGAVARAKGFTDIAEQTGLDRSALYRSFSGDYDTRIGTIWKVLDVLGIAIEFKVKTVA